MATTGKGVYSCASSETCVFAAVLAGYKQYPACVYDGTFYFSLATGVASESSRLVLKHIAYPIHMLSGSFNHRLLEVLPGKICDVPDNSLLSIAIDEKRLYTAVP